MDAVSLVSPVLRGPFTGRARREVAFCVLTLPFGVFIPLAGFIATVDAGLLLGSGPPWVADGNPSGQAVAAAVGVAALLTVLLVTTGAARRLTAACRGLAGWLLGEQVTAPPPLASRGARGLAARIADGPGWRALAYLLLKFPVMLLECFAVAVLWGAGLANLTYPFWWLSFRNHSPGTRLSSVPVITPFDWIGQGHFTVATFPGTFAAFAAGAGMVLAAPWVTRTVVAADRAAGGPGTDPGAGGRRRRHAAAAPGTRPARRRADPARHAGDEPRHGE